MSLKTGQTLAHYEILEPIGKGGMGEVYRAKDGKLGRDVAIKVLPDEFAQDEERLRRFKREAKVLASLNHPNIASIYGLEESGGTHYLVLELVPGETLADRIARGPIPVEEALEIATKIAEALEAAHERGIVHRDLKPANVKLTGDDKVKVLDFGLAKAFFDEGLEGDAAASMSPTITRDATRLGVILGTAAYMSPEQAKGKRVDKRADIWAFGVVLYEMVTGKRAFDAEDVSDTLAYVLTKEPDWSAIPAGTRSSLLPALRACVVKNPRGRVHDIADVRLALEGAFETRTLVSAQSFNWRRAMGLALAVVVFCSVLTGVAVWRWTRPEPPARPVARFSLPLPPGVGLSGTGRHVVALSSDGTRLVYTGNNLLFLRNLSELESTPVRGTEGARNPFFSPEGEWIGFWADGELKKVSVRGGAAVSLCAAETPWGARWEADGTILYGQWEVIMRVSADGGTPEVLIPLDHTAGEYGFGPQLLPGGGHVLFTLGNATNDWDASQIVVHSLDTGERKVLIDVGRDARYVPTGHLVYALEETLMAVPFDLERLEVTGGPVPLDEGVMTANTTGAAQFSVSDAGSLVFVTDELATRTLVWVDRDGREQPLAAEPAVYTYPRVSPDGSRLAVDVIDEGRDVWIWDFARETLSRFTFDPGADTRPVWSPDGQQLIFESHRAGEGNLFAKSARGTGPAEHLLESERHQSPLAMSPDGAWLVLEDGFSPRNLALLPMSGERVLEPLLSSEFNETNGAISPDGRFLAYQSDESSENEIFVRPFPKVEDGQWQISRGGGIQPRWAPDGGELFFLAPGPRMMVVDVQTETDFVSGTPRELFAGAYITSGGASLSYDLAPDGTHFLMVKVAGSGTSNAGLTLVLNWTAELERLVPTN